MKILVVDSGETEHTIAKDKTEELHTYMGRKNPGLTKISKLFHVGDESDFSCIIKFTKDNDVKLVFIWWISLLEKWIIDELAKESICSLGPTKLAVQVEANKAFMRKLLKD